MNLLRETIHQSSKLDLLVVEAADKLAELFLRRDDNPMLASAPDAETLNDGLQVEHLLNVACNELAHFIDDKN